MQIKRQVKEKESQRQETKSGREMKGRKEGGMEEIKTYSTIGYSDSHL
jgi:hypothetical protein